jgi:hypothetical protein
MQMEGSMKTMSWSRYHCLSWSFMHAAHRHRAAGFYRATRQPAGTTGAAAARPAKMSGEHIRVRRFRDYFRLVTGLFRTKSRPGDTDN